MATTTDATRRRRNELRLANAEGELAAFPEVRAEWSRMDEHERGDYGYVWSQLTGAVRSLAHEHTEGALGPEERRRFLALLRALEPLRGDFDRMLLAYPGDLIDAYYPELGRAYNPKAAPVPAAR